jgi:hypothetical protein
MSDYNVGSIGGRVVLDLDNWQGGVQQVKGDVKQMSQQLKGDLPAANEAAGEAFDETAQKSRTLAEALEEAAEAMDLQQAESRDAEAATRQVGDAARGTAAQIDRAADSTRSLRDRLKDIRSQTGEGSGVHQLSQLLVGGGIVAGFGLLSREVNKMAGAAADMSDAFRSGKASLGDMAESMAASVPIYGDIWEAGRKIRETFTGEKWAFAQIEQEFQRLGRFGNYLRQGAADSKQFADELRRIGDEAKRAAAVLGLPDAEREGAQTQLSRQDQIRSLQDRLRDRELQIANSSAPQVQELRKAISDSMEASNRLSSGWLGFHDDDSWGQWAERWVPNLSAYAGETAESNSVSQNISLDQLYRQRQEMIAQARRETAAAIAALRQQFMAEDREAALNAAGEPARRAPDVGTPGNGGRLGADPRITINAPGFDERKLANAIKEQLAPYIDMQLRQAQATALNAARNGQVRAGL